MKIFGCIETKFFELVLEFPKGFFSRILISYLFKKDVLLFNKCGGIW